MKKILFSIFISITAATGYSQTVAELQQTARTFLQQGDYTNAILVLNRAMEKNPSNLAVMKDLSLSYYYRKDYEKAFDVIKPTLDRDDADDQCFQIAGNIYKAMQQVKDCEKLYKKGLKKFPQSGPLYNDYGELLWTQHDYDAIKQWEKGIEEEPAYSKNYYNAARYYYLTTDKVWSIVYAEIFLNMEPNNNTSGELKEILLNSYKKLFSETNLEEVAAKEKNSFAKAYLLTMSKQAAIASLGVQTSALVMIRTRFILDWYATYAPTYPFKLFSYQQQLLQEGMFDAYNQWLFAPAENLAAYQNWLNVNSAAANSFFAFQKGRFFKMAPKEYYH